MNSDILTAPHNTRLAAGFFFACLFLLLIPPLTVPASAATEKPGKEQRAAEKKRLDTELDTFRIKISRLEQRINSQRAQSQEAVAAERTVLLELEEIDLQLQKQLQKVNELEQQVSDQQVLIEVKEQEISKLQKEKKRVQDHLRKRINAYYKMGKIGFLNVAFSTSSLPDLINFHEAFQQMISYDTAILNTYKSKLDDLEKAKRAFELERELLKDFITTTLDEKQETIRLQYEKKQLLAEIRTRKQLYDKAVAEMEDATRSLSSSITELHSKRQGLDQEFKLSKGELPPPVAGTVITTFNQEKVNRLGITRKSPGISIMASDRTEVSAISDGTVVFSGYLRGYGNTVIIDHGYKYYTVTSRLGEITAQKGQRVRPGTIIGKVSETAMLIDEGLYFEIRHGKTTQDPLQWLDPADIQISAKPHEDPKG